MRYWPLTSIAQSPLMPSAYTYELLYTRPPPSDGAMYACGQVAQQTTPAISEGLTVIETVGGPPRRIFLDYPNFDEWMRLEPAGVMEDCYGNLCMIYDCYH